jgi:hypothetical protein
MKKPAKQLNISKAHVEPSVDDLPERIRRRTYELWKQGGCEHGHDAEHWLQAEREVNQK